MTQQVWTTAVGGEMGSLLISSWCLYLASLSSGFTQNNQVVDLSFIQVCESIFMITLSLISACHVYNLHKIYPL